MPLLILKNPIACSYALSFNSLFFFNSSLELNLPFSSLYFIILSIAVFVNPEMYFRINLEAVFKSTPTLFTTFVTTKSRDSFNFFSFTSC